jgi:hypothetical protein
VSVDRHQVTISFDLGGGRIEVVGEPLVFIAPVGTPPEDPVEVYDPDGPWELIAPACPPTLPAGWG